MNFHRFLSHSQIFWTVKSFFAVLLTCISFHVLNLISNESPRNSKLPPICILAVGAFKWIFLYSFVFHQKQEHFCNLAPSKAASFVPYSTFPGKSTKILWLKISWNTSMVGWMDGWQNPWSQLASLRCPGLSPICFIWLDTGHLNLTAPTLKILSEICLSGTRERGITSNLLRIFEWRLLIRYQIKFHLCLCSWSQHFMKCSTSYDE